jgi:hypothetical protein
MVMMNSYLSHFLRWAIRLIFWPSVGIGASAMLIGPMSVIVAILYFCWAPAVVFRPLGLFSHEFMAPQTFLDYLVLIAFWMGVCGLFAAFSQRADHEQRGHSANSPVKSDQPSTGPLP